MKNSVILLFSLVLFTTSCMISKNTANKILQKAKEGEPYDVVIVPGFPYTEGEEFHRVIKYRMTWVKYLYENGIAKNFIFSGNSVYTPYYESKTMAEYAVRMGIPKEVIYLESKAEHSTENIYYGKLKAMELGFDRIACGTDPFQAKMIKKFNKKFVGVDLLPIPIDTMSKYDIQEPDFVPSNSLKNKDFVSIKEREGFFKRFKGTLGKNIPNRISLID